MSILGTLIGERSLRRQRDEAIDYARDLYDPSVYDPMLSEQRTRATEGIGEAGDIARARTVQSLFSPTATMTQTGNQGRALALQQQQQQGRSQALSQFESMLSERDIQTRQQAQQQFAQTRGQQLQTRAQREAAEEQAQLQYEAERSRRKQALGGAALGLVGTLATTPFGAGEGSSLVQRGLGKIFGGGGDTEESAARGLGNIFGSGGSFDAFMDADFSGENTEESSRGLGNIFGAGGAFDAFMGADFSSGDTEESVVGVPNLVAGILGEQGLNLTGQLFGSTPTPQSQTDVGVGQQSQTGEVSEETSGFDRQAIIQGMRDDIDADQLLRDFNQRETASQGDQSLNRIQQLNEKENLSFEEFKELERLGAERAQNRQLERVMGGDNPMAQAGDRLLNLFGDIGQNLNAFRNFLGLRDASVEERYEQYQQELLQNR